MTQIPTLQWPVKTREFQDHHMDSRRWNGFAFRDTDIVIASYPKSGTTWIQQIVAQLLFHGAEGVTVRQHSPWIELRVAKPERAAILEAQTHRRFVKTHLPLDALVFSPKAKYIYIGRDGRDVAWSLFNHYANISGGYRETLNTAPGRVGPPLERMTGTAQEFYMRWIEENGYPTLSLWENVRSWWNIRHLPNVKLFHFNDMKADLAAAVRAIADFLEIRIHKPNFPKIIEHCSFEYMKAHAELVAPIGDGLLNGGAKTFIYEGTNGRWRDTLSAAEIAAYEARANVELGTACAKWLANGGQA